MLGIVVHILIEGTVFFLKLFMQVLLISMEGLFFLGKQFVTVGVPMLSRKLESQNTLSKVQTAAAPVTAPLTQETSPAQPASATSAVQSSTPGSCSGVAIASTNVIPKDSKSQVLPIVDVGNLTIRREVNTRTVERSLFITNAALANAMGAQKISLPQLILPSDMEVHRLDIEAYERSIRDVEVLVRKALAGTHTAQTAEAVTVVATAQKAETPERAILTNEVTPVLVPKEPVVTTESKLPVRRDVKMSSNSQKPKRIYLGRYKSCGDSKRTGRTYTQFFVEFYDDEMAGAVNQLWGNDLRNAIDAVRPREGELIRIINFGYQSFVTPDGSTRSGQKWLIERV